MNDILTEYDKFFMDKRLGRRFATFRKVLAYLLDSPSTINGYEFNIIETGSVRQFDNWTWDGQSTRIWEWFVKQAGGHVITIDIDPAATELTEKITDREFVTAINGDSVLQLHKLARGLSRLDRIDLIYLDSFDYNPLEGQAAAIHHLKELTAIWPRVSTGTVIMVDDYHRAGRSKPELVQEFFDSIGIEPLFASAHEKGGQIAWVVK